MTKAKIIFSGLFIAVSLIIYSCHKDKDNNVEPASGKTGTLKLELESDMNGNKILLDSVYLNQNQDTFKVSSLKYYISNLRLKDAAGNYYNVPESYYLIDVSVSNDTFITIPNIPAGNYVQVELAVGIDSVHNHSGVQTGALDPTVASAMFWSWSAGYKFVLLEGTYKTASSNGYKPLAVHVAEDGNMKNFVFNSTTLNWTDINIREGKNTKIKVNVNLEEMFKTPTLISFDLMNNVGGGSDCAVIANNYADMIKLTQIVNE
jgi:hypothetical protein